MAAEDLESLFFLPLSQEAFDELQELDALVQPQAFDEDNKDKWTYHWGSADYSPSKLYELAFRNIPAHPIFSWIWKSRCTRE